MSPTIYREDGFRFYFFSREEPRLHVNVQCAEGDATIRAITHVEWPSPNHLYWPDLDIDLAVESLR